METIPIEDIYLLFSKQTPKQQAYILYILLNDINIPLKFLKAEKTPSLICPHNARGVRIALGLTHEEAEKLTVLAHNKIQEI